MFNIFKAKNIENDMRIVPHAFNGGYHLVEYLGNEQTVAIPEKVNDCTITAIGVNKQYAAQSVFSYNAMKRLVLPASVRYICPASIRKCHNLTDIEIDKANEDYLSIDGVVYGKTGNLVLFPQGRGGAYTVPAHVRHIEESAFYNCCLQKIILHENILEIKSKAFMQCEFLEEIEIFSSTKISGDAFIDCKALQKITVHDGGKLSMYASVDGVLYDHSLSELVCYPPARGKKHFTTPETVKRINKFAFAYCKNLKITLSQKTRTLDDFAFLGCENIEINEYGSINNIGADCFEYTRGVKINTLNYLLINEAKAADIDVKFMEGIDMNKKKLTKMEHAAFMPDEAKEKLEEPLEDPNINSTRAANQKLRNEMLQKFPWGCTVKKDFEIDLNHVKELMDNELYKLEDAKRQVMRSLALCMRNPGAPLRPLLLVGPAGTGKTSFAKVISDAMGRPLKRISMPSLSAAWQFTGTEKAYGTAGCGMIIQSIINAGEFPVFLFDEVDKADGTGGQYASVQHGLLNLLDDTRENFVDEFFEVPIDMRNTFFILTANEKNKVNKFVLDRCRVIYIEGYKKIDDRRLILKDYMIPKIYKDYNLTPEEYTLSEETIELILEESADTDGGLRVLQVQAEAVLQEVILRLQLGSKNANNMSTDSVRKVLAELSKKDGNKQIGFTGNIL